VAWQLDYQAEIWADCLAIFHVDIDNLSGGEALMLGNMIYDHMPIVPADPAVARSSVWARANEEENATPSDVYDPEDSNEWKLNDELLFGAELNGLVDFEEV
jgi:hypothetical protein